MPGNFYTVQLSDIAQWPKPNYIDPEQRTWLPGFAIGWSVVSSVLVIGRLYLRIRNRSGIFGLDDVLIFIAWAFSIAFTVVACISVWNYDVGRHIWDVQPADYEGALYYAWVAQVMFICATGATKTSVLLFYRRIARTTFSPVWIYAVWVLLFITAASWCSMLITYCFMCTPLSVYWDIHEFEAAGDADYKCLNGDAMTIASSVLSIASDFWCAALPCAMVHYCGLGVTKREKIALNVVFCLGFTVTGAGIARTYFLWLIGRNEDLSWIGYDLFVSSTVEIQLGVICTCAPFLRAFFRSYLPSFTRPRETSTVNSRDRWSHTTTLDWKRVREGLIQPLKPVYRKTSEDQEPAFEMVKEEKKGLLVLEQKTGRLVWNPHHEPSTDV